MAKNRKAIKARFLELLSLYRGNVQSTVSKMRETRETRISRGHLYIWKSQDKKFSDTWDRIADDQKLEVKESLILSLIRAGLSGNVGAIALYFKLVEGWSEKKEFSPAREGRENPLRFYDSLTPEERRRHIKSLRDKLISILEQDDGNTTTH
ncbi:MAG: hypothetical protein ACMUIA_01095 [bacterium]